MKKTEYVKLAISGILKIAVFFALIFLLAGRTDYWQGWGFIAITLVGAVVILFLFKDKSDLLKERMKPGPGMKWWDKIFWVFHIIFFMGILVIGVLDSGRYMWSPELPMYIYILAYVAHAISYAIVLWAMYINEFFSSVVRIQKDRGHKVIQEGPYKYVRHPGYVGVFFMAPSMPLILGSLWGLIPAGLLIIAIIIRTYLEDKTLHEELEGYKEYAKKVRYRLIPGIW